MTQRIIYPTDEGIAVIVPAISIEAAMKDIPKGKPYKIVDASEIPTDRTFRGAWEIDESLLTDGVGAEHSSF